jgi:hypothetical protein
MYESRRGIILTTMSRENYSTLGDMAFRTNEAMVFEARNSVSRHVHQNQLNACLTTQRLHFHSNPIWYRPLFLGARLRPCLCSMSNSECFN